MNYALILAGGKGTRMGSELPKQFLKLNNMPIIVHTVKLFLQIEIIDKVIIVCNAGYIDYLKDILGQYGLEDYVCIAPGGSTRLESVLNGINFIDTNFGIASDDIFIAHDSVRPFVSERIIAENIIGAKQHKAATTVMDLIETIVESDGELLHKAYPRKNLYSGQSPQTFNIKYFLDCASKIPDSVKEGYTDLSECIFYNGGSVLPVIGDRQNIKITTPIDLTIAEEIIESTK